MFGIDTTIDLSLKNEKVLKFNLVKDAIATKSKSVLEIGCGGGTIVRTLANSFPNISFIGYDNDKVAIKHANRHKRSNLRFVDNIKDVKGKFDHIILIDCLEHVDKPLPLLRKIKSLLHKNGTIIIHIPLEKQGIYACKYFRNIKSLYSQHVIFYNFEDLSALLDKAGFTITDSSFHYHIISGLRDFIKYYALYKNNIRSDAVSSFYSKSWCDVLESKPFRLLIKILDILSYYESRTLKNINVFSSGVTVIGTR